MKLIILDDYDLVSTWAAKYIRKQIRGFKPDASRYYVLGLPTGNYKILLFKKYIYTFLETYIFN